MSFPRSRRDFLRHAGAAGLALAGWRRAEGLWLPPKPAAGPLFTDLTPAQTGITWVHDNAMSPDHYLPESMCSGCAFFDYDNDGWMDIFLVNTGRCDFYHPVHAPRNALYKNNRDGTFTDITEKAGLTGGETFGEGVAVGDYDGDGWPDLYVTAYGHNILYHNNGDGTFTDVTAKAGLSDPNWSTSAVWFDYDNDGRLDLFVCSFVEYGPRNRVSCGANAVGKHYYCIPRIFQPRASKLYHNNGDGTFTEVGQLTAIGKNPGKSHGVVATDINNDGWMDLFVSNDTSPNFLFLNHGGGRFEEIGFSAGVAYSDQGTPRSGMGVDSADYDNDGWMDLYVANIDHERFSIYHNNHDETFTDRAAQDGVGQATFLSSGWGVRFFDFDNDGELDLIQANGHPDDMIEQYDRGVYWHEKPMLFQGDGAGNFRNVSAEAGPVFAQRWGARGLATGDFNNDGGVDVLISNNGQRPLLLRNEVGRKQHWLGVLLVGQHCNRDAVGARVTWRFGDRTRSRMKVGGGSYLSSHDPRLVLGVGGAEGIDWLEVRWPQPSGLVERIAQPPLDRYVTIVEGKGLQPYPYKPR
ncbi:MAG: CRTAC1 family protein [Terriglobales bacterium]